jgi:hypothetical protein
MTHQSSLPRKPIAIVRSLRPAVFPVFVAGIAFTLIMIALTRENTFFSGDGSIKFLLARQISEGVFSPALRLQADDLTATLWRQGFYPYSPPFVYLIGTEYFINIPIFFSAVTALPYKLLGWHGLYVVPTVSLWITWLVFVRTSRLLSIDETSTSVGLFALIFAAPLTLYGSLYWEHTIGVALAFCGLSILLAPSSTRGFWMTLAAGLALGSSIWFRSEMYVLNAIVLGLAGIAFLLGRRDVRPIPLAIGMATGLAVLLAFNQIAYGIVTGLHALQIIEPMQIGRAENATRVFLSMALLLCLTFPLIIPVFGANLPVTEDTKAQLSADAARAGNLILLMLLLFPIGVSFIAPSVADGAGGDGGLQWGPRFLLILIPLSCLLLAIGWQRIRVWPTKQRKWAQACVVMALLAGVAVNVGIGPWRVAKRVAPIAQTLDLLRSDPSEIVVFEDWWGPQALVGLTNSKKMFLVKDPAALAQLSSTLRENGVTRFLYVAHQPKSLDVPLPNGSLKIVAGVGFPLAISEAILQK